MDITVLLIAWISGDDDDDDDYNDGKILILIKWHSQIRDTISMA